MLRAVLARVYDWALFADEPTTCGWWTRPGGCGRCTKTAKRSDLAGSAGFRLLRVAFALLLGAALHLVCTLSVSGGVGARRRKADEREVLLGMLDADRIS